MFKVGDKVYYIGWESDHLEKYKLYEIGSTNGTDDGVVSIGVINPSFPIKLLVYRKDLHNFTDEIGLREYKIQKLKECLK